MHRYRLYGLRIASDWRLEGLAQSRSTAGPDVRVRRVAPHRAHDAADASLAPIVSPDARQDAYLRVLRRADGGFVFRFDNGARFDVSSDGAHIVSSWPESITFQDVSPYLLGPVLGFVVRLRGTLCLHASAVLVDGAAVAFLAPGGAGKSSLCAYFAQRGNGVLTDDVLALRFGRERSFRVLSGPARIRLWPDAVRHLYGPETILPRVFPSDSDWDKRYVDLAPGIDAAPLTAIYTGAIGETRAPRISRLTGRDAFLRLAGNRYPVRLPVPSQTNREFHVLTALAAQVPLRCIHAQSGMGGLGALYDAVREDLRDLAEKPRMIEPVDARVAG
jgi:hypothetical protein